MPGALSCSEVIGMNVRATLWELRRLRVSQHRHLDLAAEYLHRAGQGVSYKRATDIGGTGNCPLTDYAEAHAQERRLALRARAQADAIWARFAPMLEGMELDERSVIELYYNDAVPREDIPELIKRSAAACDRMYHEGLARL